MNLLWVAALSAFLLVEKVGATGNWVRRLRGASSPHGVHAGGTRGSGR